MIQKILILAPNPEEWVQSAKARVAEALRNTGFEIVEDAAEMADLCLCIGGDGSLLAGIRKLGENRSKIPVTGAHYSKGLGFLHPIRLPDETKDIPLWAEAFRQCVATKQFSTQQRWGLEATLSDHKDTEKKLWAMNDMVFSKGRLSRMIKVRVSVNGSVIFQELRGDGLIVASATGSTGYSLSAGGPVIAPELATLLLTPICPHEIAQRPVVLDGSSVVTIEVLQGKANCFITEDGQEGDDLEVGQVVTLKKSSSAVTWWIPESPGLNSKNYYELLRDKLGFGRGSLNVN